jgi:hypothetical protein
MNKLSAEAYAIIEGRHSNPFPLLERSDGAVSGERLPTSTKLSPATLALGYISSIERPASFWGNPMTRAQVQQILAEQEGEKIRK